MFALSLRIPPLQVSSIVGRAELLSSLFYLLALLSWRDLSGKAGVGLAVLAAWLGFLCKEQSLTVLIVCAVQVLIRQHSTRRRRTRGDRTARFDNNNSKQCKSDRLSTKSARNGTVLSRTDIVRKMRAAHHSASSSYLSLSPGNLKALAMLAGAFAAAVLVRLHLIGYQLASFNKFDNLAALAATPMRQLTYLYLAAYNFALLLLPDALCCDWSHQSIGLVSFFVESSNSSWDTVAVNFEKLNSVHFSSSFLDQIFSSDQFRVLLGALQSLWSLVLSFDCRILAIGAFYSAFLYFVWTALTYLFEYKNGNLVLVSNFFTFSTKIHKLDIAWVF